MKKLYFVSIIILFSLGGCKEDFLDTQNLTKKSASNFPGDPVEAQEALTGVYSVQNTIGTGWNNIVLYSEYMSDNRFGGGGQHDPNPQAAQYFRVASTTIMGNIWGGYYQGIFRANTLLESLGNAKGLSKTDRTKIYAETHFLRGLFYFDLARLFSSPEVVDGHQLSVPLVLKAVPVDLPRATEDAVYAQIASDLKFAIDSLPSDKIDVAWKATNLGRTSKWAAEGMLARVFLFYTGYYGKTELPLVDGGSITKAQVITWIDDIIANSGASLVPDFRNQWPYSIDQNNPYKYAVDNGLHWIGEATNTENIYEIVFTGFASNVWGEKSNYVNGFFNTGQRDPTARLGIGHGWGFGQVNPRLYADWPNADVRKKGSIYFVDDSSEGLDYVKGADSQWNETYYMEKKYVPFNVKDKTTGSPVNWCHNLYPGIDNNIQLESVQNMVLLRLADVYLMGAELGGSNAQSYLDAVRTRAGLPSVAPTLDNIKAERRFELAFEGIRYFDLLRWYGTDAGTIIQQNETGATIYNIGLANTIDNDRSDPTLFGKIPQRVKDTGGFLMIPQDQIDLSSVLKQNPGWLNASDYLFSY